MPGHRVDQRRVVDRYPELHNLAATGEEFGISRERVRQIVNRVGINTARRCRVCGQPLESSRGCYCPVRQR